jgi:hypothetical protein
MNKHLARVAYVVGALLAFVPMLDVFTALLPITVTDSRWRYGAVGLMSNAIILPLAGMLVLGVTASLLHHRRVLRGLAIYAALASVVGVLVLIMFGLDAIQTQGTMPDRAVFAFRLATVVAALKIVVGAVTYGLFAVAGFKAPAGGEARTSSRAPMVIPDAQARQKGSPA